jgi:hypothetical protein
MNRMTVLCASMLIAASVSAVKADPFPDPAKLPTAVTLFWCGPGNTSCEITCTIGGVEKKFTGLNAARVQTYPGSDKLWLETSLGPNSITLLGDALCDFSKIPITRSLQ